MSHVFTRQALYDLVWSEPMQHLAKRLAISDRGLAKVCAAANIPVPARGYWAKLQAGKKAERCPLPPRGLGQSDQVHFGEGRWRSASEQNEEFLREPIPPPPVFEPDIDVVRAEAAAMVRTVPLPLGDSHGWSHQIASFLKADEERARLQKAQRYPMSWNDPIFQGPFEQRRLRILNALFIGLARCGMRPHAAGKYARDVHVTVGNTGVKIDLDAVGAAKLIEAERHGAPFRARNDKDGLRLAISRHWYDETAAQVWEDRKGVRLERQLRTIAAAIIVFGEETLRDTAARAHACRLELRAELIEEEKKRKAEAERLRRERQAQREKARVDHLLGQADALYRAERIRAYVAAARERDARLSEPMPEEQMMAWVAWALAQADRIDPVLTGAYKTRPAESEERD